jgi:hypothetical protein
MLQLQHLSISGPRLLGPTTPARAFKVLGSLSRLTTLRADSSFDLCYKPTEDQPIHQPTEAPESKFDGMFSPSNIFTEDDVANMFFGLASLEILSIDASGTWFPDYLLKSISQSCPSLGHIHFSDDLPLQLITGPRSPLFKEVRVMIIGHVKSNGISDARAARMFVDIAPKLQTLRVSDNLDRCRECEKCFAGRVCVAFNNEFQERGGSFAL